MRNAPTLEQQRVIEATVAMVSSPIQQAGAVKAMAAAGSGKTATLNNIVSAVTSRYKGAKILYLAYNKAIRDEANQKFQGSATAYTTHGLAMQMLNIHALGRRIGDFNALHTRSILGQSLSDSEAYLIKNTIKSFSESADDAFTVKNVPNLYKGTRISEARKIKLASLAEVLFEELTPANTRSKLPLPHDVYLKYWQLIGSPGLDEYDLVMMDEAQDSNEVVIAALEDVGNSIYCGDSHQAIYEWRNAVDGMQRVAGFTYPMTKSFRFGQSVADLANKILSHKTKGFDHAIRGFENIETFITEVDRKDPHTRIFRTNRGLIRSALLLRDQGEKFSIVGNNDDIRNLVESAWQLKQGNLAAVRNPYLKSLKTWDAAVQKAEQGGDGQEINQAVKIVNEFEQRVPEIIAILGEKVAEKDAKIILTTAHRSKGREWPNVILSPDFDPIIEMAAQRRSGWDAEMNLAYVASTRAMRTLEIQSEWLHKVALM